MKSMSEAERLRGGIAMSIPANEEETVAANSSPKTLPRRLRRRLLEPKSPVSAEEIDAKLREADLRRQQYYESLSSKARPKMKTQITTPVEDLSQRLEAKLNAAEQKRLSILEKEMARLAKLDELRQAAKSGLEQRFEKERDELGTKVEERVQKAERNRLLLLKAIAQQRAAKRQRAAQSLMQRVMQESRYKECVRAAIHQKRAAAERKRLGFLEAERRRARARLSRVFGVANSVHNQRETERRKMKDRLEDRLQRAKKLRAQFLRQRRGLESNVHLSSKIIQKNQEHRVRMVQRCWRRFTESKKTTCALAWAYRNLGIDEKSIESMPFEQLALQINSVSVLRTVKALLDRLEIRLSLLHASKVTNINHLLKHFASATSRGNSPIAISKSGRASVESKEKGSRKSKKIVRYPARVFLCAYMIMRHSDAVFRGRGEHEVMLAESAANLIREFELLLKTRLDGPGSTAQDNTSLVALDSKNFRSQLEAFDKAWCSYLHKFVIWKVNDAKLLEEDLARTHEAEQSAVSKDNLSPIARDDVQIHGVNATQKLAKLTEVDGARQPVVHSDSHGSSSYPPDSSNFASSLNSGNEGTSTLNMTDASFDAALVSENELIVNEIVHDNNSSFADSFTNSGDISSLQEKVKETMEKAFWDGVMESMKEARPDFNWVLKLMKEVRDELCEISPRDWRQEIVRTIDTDVLSQSLGSGNVDMAYLGNILEFALGTLLKLSAPANEEEIRSTYHNLMNELREIAQSEGQTNSSYGILVVKGLRFVLQQLQILKKEISKARLKMLEPLLKGPAGLEYLKKAFASRYGSPDQASSSLPYTKRWLLSLRGEAETEWNEHTDALSALSNNDPVSLGIPSSTLRTGGRLSSGSNVNSPPSPFPGIELAECNGETVDLRIRLGLLKLVSEISGLAMESLPETFRLNLARLRAIQSRIQKIILVSISVLILQQTLVSENAVTNPKDMETVVSKCVHRLYDTLDAKPDSGLPEITEIICDFPEETKPESHGPEQLETRKRFVASMLLKSLQAGDPVFARVSRTVYLATRAAVLAGSNLKRKQAVEGPLRRIGAGHLSDKVIEVADVLVLLATVSGSVHGQWYEELMKKPN
ncbi:PREDICTED: uncharacterized protein LOC104813107 isoform X2 [Tarenaya hassleriana]|uniref:uncharacterized protein LOC104813107 isoform X2 n=1 Tax=Tarenaya hassleriana TaxID=28532 RepID=UPI00053C490A|nr:PREDICTED: uncharacterized protein LOC104813107 isoform X2 [Tarenaya hassleriana]